jgi:hypothetical protein
VLVKRLALAVGAAALVALVAACGGQSQSYKDGYQTGQDAATEVALNGFGCNAQSAALYDNSFDFPNDNPQQFVAGFIAGCNAG